MKKSFFKYALVTTAIALGSVALSSCSDSDDPVSEVQEQEIAWSDLVAYNLVKAALKAQSYGSGLSFQVETLSESGISFEGEDDANGPLISLFDVTPTNSYVSGQWTKQYNGIAAANDAIEKISALKSGERDPATYQFPEGVVLSTDGKNLALGGAYFTRGLAYFSLVQLYGEVPIYTSTTNSSGGERQSIEKVYEQAEADLKKAEELLPETLGSRSYPTKYAAEAILAKLYLVWATASIPAGDVAENALQFDQSKLASAVTYADKVINSNKYSLETDYLKIQPGRLNKYGAEHIYNVGYSLGDSGPNDGGNHQSHCAFSYGFDVDPKTQPPHIGPSSFDLYTKWDNDNANKQYDRRREFSYTAYLAKPNSSPDGNPANDIVYDFTPANDWLPFYGKGIDRTYYEGPLLSPYERDIDLIVIRYGEILLIKAEALIEQNKELTTAKNLINTIRRRGYNVGEFANSSINPHSLTAADIEITAASQADLRKALRSERANEFVYEQKRWFDLVRWHNFIATVLTVKDFTEYNASPAEGSFHAKVKKHLQKRYEAVSKADAKKFYLWPIPEAAIELNSKLTQNYGY